jgi:hypothetical protein
LLDAPAHQHPSKQDPEQIAATKQQDASAEQQIHPKQESSAEQQ